MEIVFLFLLFGFVAFAVVAAWRARRGADRGGDASGPVWGVPTAADDLLRPHPGAAADAHCQHSHSGECGPECDSAATDADNGGGDGGAEGGSGSD